MCCVSVECLNLVLQQPNASIVPALLCDAVRRKKKSFLFYQHEKALLKCRLRAYQSGLWSKAKSSVPVKMPWLSCVIPATN